ncbi:AraC family transcriptional regulator [Novosphingobium kunmingense]|uniref:AraC family transcriptional regulator n=1 Tax=Novosphingobium kunmingense TaxID=1211806 RepID=A0A2N0H646_9SPHN|nr:AraC family transcriptional regulator [Novosphingobium kunmingense]PKB14404.1 AraC family transcriptional regulator [Novosphingobium kunmingense]
MLARAFGTENKSIICDVLGRAPDVEMGSIGDGWSLCRWRQFVGSYTLPALPQPIFTVHIAGKPQVKTWDRDGWTETSSIPGCATIVPAGMPTGWLVDGELDVVTLSMDSDVLAGQPHADQFNRMRFAFADPLGVALTRQILAEIYAPQAAERTAYVSAMVNALKAHILSGPPAAGNPAEIPVSDFSAYRLHQIMNRILADPGGGHSLDELSAMAGITRSHFCHVFKGATGVTPHQYVMKARLDRAQQILVQSDLNLAAVAEAAGFASQSHFSRAFKAWFGMTPSDFRGKERSRQG